LFDQAPVAVDNQRQVTEWLVQRRYPIALGVTEDALSEFKAQGIAGQVEALQATSTLSTNAMGLTLLKNPPAPDWSHLSDYKVILGTPSGDAYLDKVIAIAGEQH
jgi:hypothetical protein